jgi:hypothetical protein
MSGRLLPEITTVWPSVTRKIATWQKHIERLDKWSWGPGFEVNSGDGGRTVVYNAPQASIFPGVATSAITARSGSTAGSGTFKTRSLSGTTLSDATTGLALSNNLATAVASGTALMVGYDGAVYWLISADCPAP